MFQLVANGIFTCLSFAGAIIIHSLVFTIVLYFQFIGQGIDFSLWFLLRHLKETVVKSY